MRSRKIAGLASTNLRGKPILFTQKQKLICLNRLDCCCCWRKHRQIYPLIRPSIHPSIHPCVRSPIQPDVGFPDRDVARCDSLTDRPEKEPGIMVTRGRHECLSGWRGGGEAHAPSAERTHTSVACVESVWLHPHRREQPSDETSGTSGTCGHARLLLASYLSVSLRTEVDVWELI